MRHGMMNLKLGIGGLERARPVCLRAMLALVLLFPSIVGCLNG